jgi:hypothetical protein
MKWPADFIGHEGRAKLIAKVKGGGESEKRRTGETTKRPKREGDRS